MDRKLALVLLAAALVMVLLVAGCDKLAGQAYKKPCVPTTCANLGKTCGTFSNGCGGKLNCGDCCGNGICDNKETPKTCSKDCPLCGNKKCEAQESCTSCPKDCGACPKLPPLTLATDDQSPTSDVLLLVNLKNRINQLGYGNVSDSSLKLFSEVNTSKLDNRVTIAIYLGRAIVIVGSHSPTSQVTFAQKVSSMINKDMNISVQMIVSADVKVSNLKFLFVTCVAAGGAGPNPSLGPNDPNKDKVCCDGLTMIPPPQVYTDTCAQAGLAGWGYVCTNCGDGVCNSWESKCTCPADCKPVTNCTDTDGGFNYYVKGTATGIFGGSQSKFTDSCCVAGNSSESPNQWYCDMGEGPQLLEAYCEGSYVRTQQLACPDGCKNGACKYPPQGVDAARIETQGNKLNLGEPLGEVIANLTDANLPNLLAGGTYINDGDDKSTSYPYVQNLEFGTPTLNWLRDNDYKDDQNPYVMVYGPKAAVGKYFMKYTLYFTTPIESKWYSNTACGSANELCDFDKTYITILGKNYYVTKAERSGNKVTWEMMAGAMLITLAQGETKTYTVNGKDYEVTFDVISNSSSPSVVLTVNGQSTKELLQYQTDKVAGVEIGIMKIIPNTGGGNSYVQFYLGAEKVVLTDNDVTVPQDSNVYSGSAAVDDLYSDFTLTTAAGAATQKIQKLVITWAPQDKVFVGQGDIATFPGLGSFKLEFGCLIPNPANSEKISVKSSGNDKIQLYAPLDQGDLTLPILNTYNLTNAYTGYGKSSWQGEGVLHIATGDTLAENDYVLLSDDVSRETHVIQLKSITSANLIRVEDIVSKVVYETNCTAGSATCTISVGNTPLVLTTATLDSNAGTITINAASTKVRSVLYTRAGLSIDLNPGSQTFPSPTHSISVREKSSTGVINAGSTITLVAALAPDGTTYISTPVSPAFISPDSDHSIGPEYADSAVYGYMTSYGTLVKYYTLPVQDYVEIYYPGTETHGVVYVAQPSFQITSDMC